MELPDPRIWLVRDSNDAPQCARAVNALADLARGIIVVHVTPGPRRLHWIALDLLGALGKDITRPGVGRSGEENWRRCTAWMSGERVQDLVVDRVELLQPDRWRDFMGLAAHCGVTLWLIVHGESLNRGQRELLDDWPFAEISFDQFVARHELSTPDDPAQNDTPARVAPSASPPILPSSDFTTFRADCRRLLEPSAFRDVERELQSAADRTRRWLVATPNPTVEGTWEHLRDLIGDCRSTREALIRLRAAQAICLTRGLLVNVDIARLAASTETPRPLVNEQLVSQLRAYASTHRAAVALVSCITDASPEAISWMNARDATETHVTVAGTEFSVPRVASSLIAAHLHFRSAAGAHGNDPLFSNAHRGDLGERSTPRAIRRALDDVGRGSGLLLWSEPTYKDNVSNRHWLPRRGVAVQDIR